MDYKENVRKVMDFLRAKKVCTSSQRSHIECYEALEAFMVEKKESYSTQIRDLWLDEIERTAPRQRLMVWEQYVLQLEEMADTGSISDRRLYLNLSDYEKLPASWKDGLDKYLEHCSEKYTERTLQLTKIYCSKALLYLQDNGICDVWQITYDVVFLLIDWKVRFSGETKALVLNNTARMFDYWSSLGWCPENYATLLNGYLNKHVGRIKDFSSDHVAAIMTVAEESKEFPAAEFRDSIEHFVNALECKGYVGTTLKLTKHALTALYLFLDIHSLGYHPVIMWAWFEELRKDMGSSWLQWRRILRTYEDYTTYGDVIPVGKYSYEPDTLSQLPDWCRQAVDGFLVQKKREFREPGTIRCYRYSCIRFCKFLLNDGHDGFDDLNPETIKAFARQDKHNTFNGRATCFVIVRSFLKYLGENKCTKQPYLYRCLYSGTAPEEKIVDILSDEELSRIDAFRSECTSPIELRDLAIVLLGTRMGLRSSDVLQLRLRDIDWKKSEISIVMQKTQTQITLPMPVDVGNAIYAYIKYGRPETDSGYLFLRSKAPHTKMTGRVCTNALCRILPERNGIPGGFHITRRTFATNLLRNRAGIDEVIDALGHRDPTSIMTYLLLDDERSRMCGLSLADAGIPMKGGLV